MLRVISWMIVCFGLLATLSFAGPDRSYSPDIKIDTVPFYPGGTYDPEVPHPNDYLKHPLGQWPLRYVELLEYIKAVDAASDRVTIEQAGATFEDRPLMNVFISTPEHIARLDAIRADLNTLADPAGLAGTALDGLVQDLPAAAWLGYTIHGDEVSGTDAAAMLIYQLAAGTDEGTLTILNNVVTIVNPLQNPDGRERYLAMLQTYKSSVPNYNRSAMQHQGVWPWGRTNHYLFDLNRDWILAVHPETRSKLATLTKWHPQLIVDGHEMGSNATFLFSPPREPINYNTPDHYRKWSQVFADDQAAAFDARRWTYYTGEWHEQWYPGYGSAWGTFSGSIGILYEMAGVDGEFVKQRDDYLLTYHEAINKQFTSSVANLTSLADHRVDILRDYHNARAQIVADGRKSNLSFVFRPGRDEIRMNRFIKSLLHQGIEVGRATSSFTLKSAQDTRGNKQANVSCPAGSYVVSTAQPMGALVKAALEFDPHLKLDFLKEERKELEKHGETRMYEVSAWSPVLAYDLDAWMTTSPVAGNLEQVDAVAVSPGSLHDADARYGFVIDMVGEKTNLMLARLFEHGVVVRTAEKPFTVDGRKYAAGSLFLALRGNRENLPELLATLATDIGLDVYGVNTGNSSEGSMLGAPTFRLLKKPRIGILAGDGMDYGSFGELWFMLDQELAVPHSLVNATDVAGAGISQYNVLVVPGSWSPFGDLIGDGGVGVLKDWVRDGGTLICVGRSAEWAADTSTGMSQVQLKRQVLNKLDTYDLSVTRERQAEAPTVDTMALYYPEKVPTEDGEDDKKSSPGLDEAKELDEWQRKFYPGGVIMRADVDTEDWLAFGMNKTVPVMMYTRSAFMSAGPVKTVARLADRNDLRLSGLLWPEARERWANTAWSTRESSGKGQIILFATDPHMRAYWYGSRQLMVNAILYGPGMGARFEGPYSEQ
ncbi:MAG: hypothetical protein KKA42_07875 [candidate division Zixibacteria bacterium]|nr:hypothetical protein [candidate division Zixibacteria bacterium]